jgi:hypothetical protein
MSRGSNADPLAVDLFSRVVLSCFVFIFEYVRLASPGKPVNPVNTAILVNPGNPGWSAWPTKATDQFGYRIVSVPFFLHASLVLISQLFFQVFRIL